MEYVIEETKTECGTRLVPMTDEVKKCFRKIIENRKKPKTEPMIDGKVGFLYLDKNDMPMVALHWEKYFQHICEKYNYIQSRNAKGDTSCLSSYILLKYGKVGYEP